MRKLILCLLMCIMLAIPSIAAESAQSGKAGQASKSMQTAQAASTTAQVWVNGKAVTLSKPAYAENKTIIVPLDEVAKALGAKVTWGTGRDNRNSATIVRGTRSAKLTIGSASLDTGGRTVKLEAAPRRSGSVVFVPVRALSEALGTVVAWDAARRIVHIDDPAELPAVGTYKKLKTLIETATARGNLTYTVDGIVIEPSAKEVAAGAENAAAESPVDDSDSGAADVDYSLTNVQVSGVDEADWAKTDGRFVYQISGSRVFVADVSDPQTPKLRAQLEYRAEEQFAPLELYVDGSRLVVIGRNRISLPAGNLKDAAAKRAASSSANDKFVIMPSPRNSRSAVKTKIYELAGSGAPKLVRETTLEGDYISSRKIGGALYIVANKGYYYPTDDETAADYEPWYGDTGISSKLKKLPLDQIRYFPDSPDASTMLIGALDLDSPEREMQVSAYLGSGQTIYASAKHLYVAISESIPQGEAFREQTRVHKFRLDGGSIVYAGEGTVPGTVLNQYSMDEHNGYFRIATTKGYVWGSGEDLASNNLYVLDESMKTAGKLEKLAPGERIYSARFLGGRAYMVTFRNVDPLFVIDLHNPAKPAVLGQLKIPGYSDYLHPYDDNHIIGFGKDTAVQQIKGAETDEPTAFYQGLKMAMFDVSDVTRPKEMFKEVIGDRGTDSELLSNPKALLFSKSKNLLAFPVELMEIPNKPVKGGSSDITEYGQFTYQGAYVYRVDLKEGFKLRGRITHLSNDDLLKSSQYDYDYSKSVRRILYAGDTLFTLSDSFLKASDLNSLAERGELAYPAPSADEYTVQSVEPMPNME